jgi:hemerythrin-like domain-containing protein
MADVFEVLKQDHDKVRRMLAELHIGPTAQTGATENQLTGRKRLTDQLIIAEARHQAVEEEFFWPMVRKQGAEADKLADQAVAQAQKVRQALAALDRLDAAATEFEPLLTDVIAAGFEHIEFEEQLVWPLLRRAISLTSAVELGSEIAAAIRQPGRIRPPDRIR